MPRKTIAELEKIIETQRANIAALHEQERERVAQFEKMSDDWNTTQNRVQELEKQAKKRVDEHKNLVEQHEKELAISKQHNEVLQARLNELWRAYTHVTTAFAPHK